MSRGTRFFSTNKITKKLDMRKLILIPLLLISLIGSAATYYVSPTGNDSNNGSINSPWLTLQYGVNHISAGDILYMRGGTYRSTYNGSSNVQLRISGLTGSSGSPINILAYPGETPVFNMDNISSSVTDYCFLVYMNGCSYVNLKGLRITGYSQPSSGAPITGMYIVNSPNCTFEQITVDHIGGYGIVLASGSNNILFKNCDVHHCVDRYGNPNGNNKPYEDANGFNITGGSTATNVTYDGCRAWNCSDDGWDFFLSDGYVTINNCWSFWNGYDDSFNGLGNGQGFKLGPFVTNNSSTLKRVITNCISARNRTDGYDQNTVDYSGLMHFYNNIAYANGSIGFAFSYLNGISNVFRNNISYANSGSTNSLGSGTVQDHNSWNGGVTVSDADFVTIGTDVSVLSGPRKSDGSLPDITLLHLVSGSDLIDAGVNVGTPFSGNAPDMGAFETQLASTPAVPVYVSSVIENANPSVLKMTYNLALANMVPAASSFSVNVNSAARTVSSVAVSGTTVLLTLATPVVNGNVVTVTYAKPATNPIQTAAGGQAAALSAQTVTNNVNAVTLPVYVSSAIQNTTPGSLEMTYNLSLANIVPAASSFRVNVNSTARSVNSVSISGTKVLLMLATPVVFGDIVTVAYTKPATAPLQTAAGGQAASISTQPVTNNLVSPTKDPVTVTLKMTISPNPVHNIINIQFLYSNTQAAQDPAVSAKKVRILDLAGNLQIEKYLNPGVASVRIPANLLSGIYTVSILSPAGLEMASQKIIVN
jgi:uncharacterized repeat protein (TIGR02059 family)